MSETKNEEVSALEKNVATLNINPKTEDENDKKADHDKNEDKNDNDGEDENKKFKPSTETAEYIAEMEAKEKDRQEADYGSQEYWEHHYLTFHKEEFDWLIDWEEMKGHFAKIAKPEHKILIVGCGNAPFSIALHKAGYKHIVNMDYSAEVINLQKSRYGNLEGVEWHIMDITAMTYKDEEFDVVVDKSTLDALMCYEGFAKVAASAFAEIHRVLKKDGVYIIISWSQTRAEVVQKYHGGTENWDIKLTVIQDDPDYNANYFYVCNKLIPDTTKSTTPNTTTTTNTENQQP